jgi:CRISPR-associated protein Cmr1
LALIGGAKRINWEKRKGQSSRTDFRDRWIAVMKLELELQTVTPLFLGGAEPRGQPELRPASVRGVLRYWLRAALGGVIGDNNLDKLRRLEATVFGETERGSAVVVRLQGNLSKMTNYDLDRNQQGQQLRTGHNYFYYSTRLKPNSRTPFTPGETDATLTLTTRLGVANADDALRKAAASVWLLTHLGGLGMRARRCGGSLQVASGSLSGLPELVVSAQTAADLQTHLATGLQQISAMMGSLQYPPSDFGVLHPDVCRIWVIADQSPWQTWKAAVNAMGNAMKTFRAGQPDRNRTNAIFGLPIHHAPYDIKQLAKRRSSPLCLRVTKLANGDHVGVATLFKADFLDGRPTIGGGYKLIEQFLTSCFPTCLEVNYR